MKSIDSVVLVFVLLLVVGLVNGSVSLHPVFAAPPDPCFGKYSAGCPNMAYSNNPAGFEAYCCWTDIHDGKKVCNGCGVDTDTREFENCTDVQGKGKPDRSTVIPAPSDLAPSPSTVKCPDNSAVDFKGNCTLMVQSPDNSSANDDNKPKFLRSDILGELQTNQGTQTPF